MNEMESLIQTAIQEINLKMNWAEVLRKAINILEERGWCQGSLIDQRDQVCALGAIALALGHSDMELRSPLDEDEIDSSWFQTETGQQYTDVIILFDLYGQLYDHQDLAEFNDDPHTSKEDIVLFLKNVAYDWEHRND